ncbi:carboxymuconolactone decarboxylase family protein [Ignatzschineria indica]|uniref:carboxymuconolactone decarboxylase family protein n=1 Tax=Ignatzschineria indica TaxID=472583 RepID=UPI00257512BD|nr:carboxymuconolactone decarboxylase family protein [Ignatzschineria indica]MDM1544800.1 carboxymuconolactone decarboxylase family protein [Ignatzschineria indica]
MAIETIKEMLPAYAKDMRLNFSTVLTEAGAPGLTEKQIAAIAVSVALSTKCKVLIDAMEKFAQDFLTEEEFQGAQIATSIMSMNNIYYRFTHLVSNDEYTKLPARLRMNQMANPGLDKATFELASIAVSAVNGCGMCVDSHEKNLRQLGVSSQGIQSAVRIAAVLFSVSVSLADK